MGSYGKSKYMSEEWVGKKFNDLTIIGYAGQKNGIYMWKVKCNCGNETIVSAHNVISGHTKSCGCYKKKIGDSRRTHGCSKTKLYFVWKSMFERCRGTATNSKYYFGKGITVCEEWKDFSNFHNWAIQNGYADNENLSIERNDINGDYCPENCMWIKLKKQARNRSTTRWIEYQGRKMSLAEACEIAGMPYKQVHWRIQVKNWPAEKALSVPFNTNRR